jgi:GNAT superfamily N-acetyltransferase
MLKRTETGKYQRYEYYDGANHVGEFLLLAYEDVVNVVELRGFEIYPQYRGKGLSYGMLACVVEEARAYKFPILNLKVKKDNDPAVRLYTNAGFVIKRDDADKSELEMELEV